MNLMKGILEHIMFRYYQGIVKYPDSVDLRISLSYVLNNLALLKNQSLTMAYRCQVLKTTFCQDIEIRKLLKYLEEEEIYHDRGLGINSTSASTQSSVKQSNGKPSGNVFIQETNLDIKTYQKRMILKIKFFIMRVMKSLSYYEDFWKELSLETPRSSKVKEYLAKYYSSFKGM